MLEEWRSYYWGCSWHHPLNERTMEWLPGASVLLENVAMPPAFKLSMLPADPFI